MAENTIPLEQAQTWRSNWKTSRKDWMAANDLQGFWVPGDDLTQTVGENGVNCRIYMGLTEEGTSGEAKMMMVAVDADGKDMIDPDNGLYIYDFSQPIPPMDDPSSPLN
ncbi:MAG: hypothetical protein ACSHWW_10970 [Nonlabens sp.]|uniref:hypothetical protein n=1 Tax=Nonlabens sp. TaxID=1888209 RepID=UPI003EF15615